MRKNLYLLLVAASFGLAFPLSGMAQAVLSTSDSTAVSTPSLSPDTLLSEPAVIPAGVPTEVSSTVSDTALLKEDAQPAEETADPAALPDSAVPTDYVAAADSSAKPKSVLRPFQMGLSLLVGTVGPGLSLSFSFLEKWHIRITGSYLQFNYNERNTDLGYDFKSTVKTGGAGLMLDIYPFNKARGVGFTVGAMYNFIELSASGGSTKDSIGNGEFSVTKEQIGTISTKFTPGWRISPYFALAFGRALPLKRVSFRFELGAMYIGKPNVEMVATGLVEPTKDQAGKIADNISNYNFYPCMSFHLNFKLTK